jgi:hypothetical protein
MAIFRHIAFGPGPAEGSGLHAPTDPPAYKMNARLFIPNWMQVDHEGQSLGTEQNPQSSVDTILKAARKQFDTMARRYPKFPITQAKAVDDIIRRSPEMAREEQVDPGIATARQRAEVPSTINPVELYGKILSDFRASHPSTEESAPKIESVTDKVRSLLSSGKDPLRTYYEATINIILCEWNYQDKTRNDTAQRAREATSYERRYLSALLEHRRAMHEITRAVIRSTGFNDKPLQRRAYTHY